MFAVWKAAQNARFVRLNAENLNFGIFCLQKSADARNCTARSDAKTNNVDILQAATAIAERKMCARVQTNAVALMPNFGASRHEMRVGVCGI